MGGPGNAAWTKDRAWPTARLSVLLLAALLLTACATGPRHAPDATSGQRQLGARIAATAQAQLGRPYRYGGRGPDAFDCSGLVHFAHAAHGVAVPRTTADQFDAATRVPATRLAAGDLLFFRFESGRKVSHVGIYLGEGRFVHAPQAGRPVEVRRLDDPGYRSRLAATGRLH